MSSAIKPFNSPVNSKPGKPPIGSGKKVPSATKDQFNPAESFLSSFKRRDSKKREKRPLNAPELEHHKQGSSVSGVAAEDHHENPFVASNTKPASFRKSFEKLCLEEASNFESNSKIFEQRSPRPSLNE